MPRMADLARQDEYLPDVGDPLVPSGPQVSPGVGWANRLADRLPTAVMGGLAQMVETPGALMKANPYPPGSEEAAFYDASKVATANEWAPGMALNMMGGGVAGTGKVRPNEIDLTAGYDPKLWHGVSQVKLPKPIDEMTSVARPVNPAPEVVASPARFQNSLLMPLLGDRTATAAALERVNGFQFDNPVSLEGGHGYMANNPGMAWAAGKSIAPGIGRVAREGAESGLPVHGVYTAMGERSADFSHMVSDTLTEMAKHTKITPEGAALFNETMRKVSPGFPGIHSPDVAQYLRDAPGAVRNVFAKTMDTAPMQKHGFPSVAEARVAVTDPRLLNEPTGAAGLSIARMDPSGKVGPSGHGTYDTGIRGDYVAGLPASVPKEVMFPDVLGALSKHADAVAQARVDAGLKPFRPTEDYLMSRSPKGLPKFQKADQQWVDSVSKHLEDRGFTLGSGATDKKMGAILAATDNQSGIKAYHSSPHDFDRFDLSKIGTGEGAQVYGHGLYFAENPAVSGQGGQYWNQFSHRFLEPGMPREVQHAVQILQSTEGNRAAAIAKLDEALRLDRPTAIEKRHMQETRDLLASDKPVGPRTYEVNIKADPAQMLDWDKPLEGHPLQADLERAGVRAHVASTRPGEPSFLPATGRDAYQSLAKDIGYGNVPAPSGYGNNPAGGASHIFREAGIPGIKYLDAGSRGTGTGSNNYVVFDPSIIEIMKKYGIAGAAPAGMGALAAQDYYRNP
jgi:hypothetical protein